MADVKPVITYSPEDDKWAIRQKIWDHIEAKDLANFPRPVHNRIPNFKDANIAADQAKGLEVFKKAQTVKINPDKPQEQARFSVLEATKNLLVPTPRLKEGLFNKINPPPNYTKDDLRICSTSQGVKEFSAPIDLDSKIKVDLIILGSVAVSPKGLRIGKGEGYADLEYGMMRCLGAVDEDTPIITTVHDCQVMEDLPEDMFGTHDVPVDWIITPTRVIQCEKKPRPSGIYWSLLTKQKLKQVPILKKLRDREREAGVDVRIKSDMDRAEATTEGSDDEHHEEGSGDRPRAQRRKRMSRRLSSSYAIFVGRFPRFLRASDFKAKVKESCDPIQVIWRGRNGYAFLVFETQEKCDEALKMLQGLAFNGKQVKVEMAVEKPPNGPSDGQGGHSEESGNESRPAERGGGRRFERRRRGGPSARGRSPANRGRRRAEASDHEEYDTAEDGDDERRRSRRGRGRVDPNLCVFMGSLPRTVRASEFKAKVRENDVNPIRVVWRGRNRYALLQFVTVEEASAAFKALHGFEIDGKELSVQESTGESSRQRDDDHDSGDEGGRRPPPRSSRGGRGGRRPGGRSPGGRGGGSRRPPRGERRSQMENSDLDEGQGDMSRKTKRYRRPRPPLTSVFVGNLPRKLRISDFKTKVRESEVNPTRVQWRGNQGHAFLQFDADDKAEECIKLLKGLTIDERELTVEMSTREQRGSESEQRRSESEQRRSESEVNNTANNDHAD